GRFHAKYQKSDGNWTTKSLGTKKKAKAKIELGKFAQRLALMQAQPTETKGEQTIRQLVADFVHFIKDNRSEGWASIQRLYLKRMLEFFGPDTLGHGDHNEAYRRIRLVAQNRCAWHDRQQRAFDASHDVRQGC